MTDTKEPEALAELIQRLEKARGPDRELDAAIWAECGDGYFTHQASYRTAHPENAPEFSASIDAALTLVPEYMGKPWFVALFPSYRRGGIDARPCALVSPPWSSRSEEHVGQHEFPAIALCIAALKARERQ